MKAASFRDFLDKYEQANPSKATTCGVCALPVKLREEVDALLSEGRQKSQIARALKLQGHGKVTENTVRHHARNHIVAA